MSDTSVFDRIKQQLDSAGYDYILTEHEPVRTSEEAAKIRGVDLKTGAKAMVVKSKDQYFLLVLPANKRISWKKVKTVLGVKDIRFATEEEAEKVTQVQMGSVPPFGNILQLPTFFDSEILKIDQLNFNPGSRRHSISMKSKDLVNLVLPQITNITEM